MAVATNCNPGSSPCTSILLAMHLACSRFRMTPEEALTGVTRHAAAALGLSHRIGTIEVGKAADLAVWSCQTPAELSFHMGLNTLLESYVGGEKVSRREAHSVPPVPVAPRVDIPYPVDQSTAAATHAARP
jgi:imidazolonepropionase